MYSWIDQGGKSLTLKPELTAPVIRAYVQNQLDKQSPIHRLYYFDTLFYFILEAFLVYFLFLKPLIQCNLQRGSHQKRFEG